MEKIYLFYNEMGNLKSIEVNSYLCRQKFIQPEYLNLPDKKKSGTDKNFSSKF